MTLLRESALCRLWLLLLACYQGSALHRSLAAAGGWCSRQIDESRVLRPLCREGIVARAWPDSLLCRLASFLFDLPARLLRRIFRLLRPTLEDSFFARLAFTLGDETAVGESWLILLLWVIPFSRWNNAYTFMAFGFLLLLFHAGAMHRPAFRLDVKSIGFYPMVLFGAMVLAVAFSRSRNLSTRFLVYHLSAALCVLVTVSAVRHTEDLKRLAAGAAGCVLVSSLYGVVQRLQGIEVNASYVDLDLALNETMPGRVMSFFDNPNTFAEVLLLLLPLALALALSSKRLLSRLIAFGVFAVGVGALLMTYSRASWVGFAAAMVVMVFLWKPKLLPLFFLLCCLAVPFLPLSVWNRILTIGNTSDSSTASRFPLYEAALRVIGKSPVSGAGLGTAAVQRYIRLNNLYKGNSPFVHAHNFYLQIWIEAGLLGIVSFVASMLWNIKRAAHTVRHCGDSAARTLTCAAAAALCGSMVCGLADYLWNYPRVLCIFWFVFAMALAGVKLCLETRSGQER